MRIRKIKTKFDADGNPVRPPETVRHLPDGKVELQFTMTEEEMAKFYRACNVVSEELGRPVSMDEALRHMVNFNVEQLEAELNQENPG